MSEVLNRGLGNLLVLHRVLEESFLIHRRGTSLVILAEVGFLLWILAFLWLSQSISNMLETKEALLLLQIPSGKKSSSSHPFLIVTCALLGLLSRIQFASKILGSSSC